MYNGAFLKSLSIAIRVRLTLVPPNTVVLKMSPTFYAYACALQTRFYRESKPYDH